MTNFNPKPTYENLESIIDDLQSQLSALRALNIASLTDAANIVHLTEQLSASREKEKKLIEHYEKRIETEVSKVAQLLRERQAERAAVLEQAADICKRHDQLLIFNFNAVKDEPSPEKQIRALITPTDRLALDRYVEEKVREARLAEAEWKKVKDGLPVEYGDYLVVRENDGLHIVTLGVTNFHPRAQEPWYDKGFTYLYWIGPIKIPKELEPEMIGRYKKSAFPELRAVPAADADGGQV